MRHVLYVSALVLPWILATAGASGSSTLIFPRLSFGGGADTGIAFVNPTSSPVKMVLTMRGRDGLPVTASGFHNPAELTIPAGQQVARTVSEVFGGAPDSSLIGWIEATSESEDITGFFLYLLLQDGALLFLDGADLPAEGSSLLFLTAGLERNVETEINIVNPTLASSRLTLELIRPGLPRLTKGDALSLPPKGMARFAPSEYFVAEDYPPGSYLLVSSSNRIAGFQLGGPGEGDRFGLNAKPAREELSQLYIPQFAVLHPWKTTLTLVNSSEISTLLTISAFDGKGKLFPPENTHQNPVVRALKAGESLNEDVEELFGFRGEKTLDGWLGVESTSNSIQGFVSYRVIETGALAAVAAQPTAKTGVLFSHIATDLGYYTGIALLNPGTLAANFRVVALKENGEIIGRYTGVLGGRARLARLIHELIPGSAGRTKGFIWVQSSQPLYATSLFGANQVLAYIPPQPAPELEIFNPDSGQPVPTVTPPLAPLQPGHSHRFISSGFSNPVSWAVNDSVGGDEDVGVIDSSGFYTAPDNYVAPRSLKVTALTADEAAGAGVDIIPKELLLSGLGWVQSVAYLGALKKIFTAEIIGFNILDNPGRRPAADSDGSQIFAAYPNRVKVAEFSGDFISTMVPFVSSDGQEFLLLAARESGRVVRLDPQTGQSQTVLEGLSRPSALAFDTADGNLLVADGQTILSFSPDLLEPGLKTTGQSSDSSSWRHSRLAGDFVNLVGLEVDRCTGNLYVSEGDGGLIELNRVSGERRFIDSGRNLTSLLGVYRTDVPCPSAFHLLAAEPENSKVHLFVPSAGIETLWLEGSAVHDFSFLPTDNEVRAAASILLGEQSVSDPSGGQLSLMPVTDLYEPPVAASEARFLDQEDPTGDAFGPSSPNYDIVSIDAEIQGESLRITVGLSEPFEIFTTNSSGTELTVGVEFDIDQSPDTGFPPVIDLLSSNESGLGAEFAVETEVDQESGTVPIYELIAPGEGVEVTSAPVYVEEKSLTVWVPTSSLEAGSCVDFVVEVGYYNELENIVLTDFAPNLGHFTVCIP